MVIAVCTAIEAAATLMALVWKLMGKPDPTEKAAEDAENCLLYTSPSPRDGLLSRMPSSA